MPKTNKWWPKGFRVWEDKKPPFKLRCQHRKSGTMIDLESCRPKSAAFYSECTRLDDASKHQAAKPGTLGLLVEKYRGSRTFLDLAPRTRSDYQMVLSYLQPLSDTPLTRFTSPFIVLLRDKAHEDKSARFGTYVKQVLSVVFAWGKERGLVKDNPALGVKGVKRKRNAPQANRPWSDQERETVLAKAPPQLCPAIALMMFTGLGPADALTLPKSAHQDGALQTLRAKTGTQVYWPIIQPLGHALIEAPKHEASTLLANSFGRSWTVAGFRASWNRFRRDLEERGLIEAGLTLYGLRHSVATILREAGMDDRTIADALAQTTETMARHYSKRADIRSKMEKIAPIFEAEVTRRRAEVSNRQEKSVKPDKGADDENEIRKR
ncbi:MAG: tyrosine-type recombinase/integrase, partial [Roseibium sp.]